MASENSIYFQATGGHSHNGINSTLIDVGQYSVFDFTTSTVGSPTRITRQEQNRINFEDFIVRTIQSKVLQPAGIRLEANTFNGKAITANTIQGDRIVANTITANQIAANTITAGQIAANTITAGQIAANTITANEIATGTITGIKIAANAIGNTQIENVMSIIDLQSDFVTTNAIIKSNNYISGSVGWAINANGIAEFSDVLVRGTVIANDGYVGGWDIASTYIASNNGSAVLYSNGYLYAQEGLFQGSLSGATITGADGVFSGSMMVSDGTNGIEITTSGFLRGTGGSGIRIMNSDNSTGNTQLFKDFIRTDRFSAEDYFLTSNGSGAEARIRSTGRCDFTMTSTTGEMFDMSRGYDNGMNFIRFVNYNTNNAVGAIEFNGSSAVKYVTSSDSRLKSNIKILSNGLSIIKEINPVSFKWIEDPNKEAHGFIAQDLYKAYPHPVTVGGDDVKNSPWMVDYAGLVPILTSAIKELIERVENLEARLNEIIGV